MVIGLSDSWFFASPVATLESRIFLQEHTQRDLNVSLRLSDICHITVNSNLNPKLRSRLCVTMRETVSSLTGCGLEKRLLYGRLGVLLPMVKVRVTILSQHFPSRPNKYHITFWHCLGCFLFCFVLSCSIRRAW